MSDILRVAVDAMGGDHAPHVVAEGALTIPPEEDVQVILVGPEKQLQGALATASDSEGPWENIAIVDAPDVIGMDESPTTALKTKPGSSIHHGLGLVKQGKADAFASAGNTGAVMAAATYILGRIEGVSRPTIPAWFPTPDGTCVVLDVGANVDCRPEMLLQFAQMGNVLVHRVLDIEQPRIGLLNIGEEPSKGTETVKAAYALLEEAEHFDFIGNVEGRDIFRHAADVIVCDGFVGNIILKLGESIASVFPEMIRREISRQKLAPEQAKVVGGVLKQTLRNFDYSTFGGMPLLGIDGVVAVGHGSSSAPAIAQMIRSAASYARADLPGRLAKAFIRGESIS